MKGIRAKSKSEFEKSLVRLRKSLALCSGQDKRALEKDIENAILRVNKCIWFLNVEEERETKKKALQAIRGLVNRDPRLRTTQEKEQKYQTIVEAFWDPLKESELSVPDFYCCFITKKLLKDPVIVSSGFSYERSALSEYIQKNQWRDPRTGTILEKDLIYNNINLKQAIETFVKE